MHIFLKHLNRPFGAMIKPIFDSMSVSPGNGMAVSATSNASTSNPTSIFEPRPPNPGAHTNDSDTFIR